MVSWRTTLYMLTRLKSCWPRVRSGRGGDSAPISSSRQHRWRLCWRSPPQWHNGVTPRFMLLINKVLQARSGARHPSGNMPRILLRRGPPRIADPTAPVGVRENGSRGEEKPSPTGPRRPVPGWPSTVRFGRNYWLSCCSSCRHDDAHDLMPKGRCRVDGLAGSVLFNTMTRLPGEIRHQPGSIGFQLAPAWRYVELRDSRPTTTSTPVPLNER